MCYMLNIYGMDQRTLSGTYRCTCEGDSDSNEYTPTCEQKVIYERATLMAVTVVSIPDAWCFLYSFYFILFKQVEWPQWNQFFILLAFESLYAVGQATMVFLGKCNTISNFHNLIESST